MHIRCERRDFNGEIEAREWTLRPDIAEAGRGFLRKIFRDGIEDLKVALEESVGLGLVDDRLAEEVDGGGEARFDVFLDLLEEILAAFPATNWPAMSTICALTGAATRAGAKEDAASPTFSAGLRATAWSPRYS